MYIIDVGLFGSSTNKLKCKKCGTVLSDNDRLKKHQEKAHNKKKEKCGAEFNTLEDLRKHKKIVNNDSKILK